jgi:hypothetical protein
MLLDIADQIASTDTRYNITFAFFDRLRVLLGIDAAGAAA